MRPFPSEMSTEPSFSAKAGYIITNNTNANVQITESMVTSPVDVKQATQLLYTTNEFTGVVIDNLMVFAISQTTFEMGTKRNLMRKKNGNVAFFLFSFNFAHACLLPQQHLINLDLISGGDIF